MANIKRGRLVKTPSELTSTPKPWAISPKIVGKAVKGALKTAPIKIITRIKKSDRFSM